MVPEGTNCNNYDSKYPIQKMVIIVIIIKIIIMSSIAYKHIAIYIAF